MTDTITPELFQHLVQLAALELSPQEAEYLRGELNKQLKAIQELEAIPLSESIQATSHGVPYTPDITPPIRADEQAPRLQHGETVRSATMFSIADILAQAPEIEDGYIVVPDIPHTEL